MNSTNPVYCLPHSNVHIVYSPYVRKPPTSIFNNLSEVMEIPNQALDLRPSRNIWGFFDQFAKLNGYMTITFLLPYTWRIGFSAPPKSLNAGK
jgi:hypothetical protein